MSRRSFRHAAPWAAVCGASWGFVAAFYARLAYVSNWALDESRSALVVKPEWFGPSFVDFASVRGIVSRLWDSLAGGGDALVVLPFDAPAAMTALLALSGLVGLYAFVRASVGSR